MVDNVCLNAVRGISDLVMVPGLINVDFADVRTIMTGMGRALMGSGRGTGDKRAIDAAQMAINSPLLEDVSINGATGILVNITGGPDLTLAEVNEACSLIQEAADPDANIIFGSVIDSLLADEVRLTVIATGFQSRIEASAPAPGVGGRNVRRSENQMALPMQPAAHVSTARFPSAAADLGELADDGYPQPYPPVTTSVSYPAVSPMPLSATGGIATAAYPAADWSNEGRPIIRPQVGSSMGAGTAVSPGDRRRTPMLPALASEDLGIEESEFDKPTYLRRSLAAHGDPPSR
jgi:hypothetical protein